MRTICKNSKIKQLNLFFSVFFMKFKAIKEVSLNQLKVGMRTSSNLSINEQTIILQTISIKN